MKTTVNPKDFKLRIVWGFEINQKCSIEYCDSSWIPKTGEILILPLEEITYSWQANYWHKFFAETVAYDFQHQITRVICKSLNPSELRTQYFKSLSV
jgi:hypothetical protein